MKVEPFKVDGRAVVSVSGGRTSAVLLWNVLQAHGGALPDEVVAVFANTGREREETLRFVHECGARWGARIAWVEWRPTTKEAARIAQLADGGLASPDVSAWALENANDAGFEVVGLNSVSRKGEPFSALIALKHYLPNAVTRFCTEHLKVLTIKRYLLSLGWTEWMNLVGLRRDEGHRILKRIAKEASEKWREPYRSKFPLDKAGIRRADVKAFWPRPDGFDLGIASHDGNCDGCFLKSWKRLQLTEQAVPGTLSWWSTEERSVCGRFVTEYDYASIIRAAREQQVLPFDDVEERDVECGDTCDVEEAA